MLQAKFTNRVTSKPKDIECIRVDSGGDEAPLRKYSFGGRKDI